MLNSFQVAAALKARGFTTITDPERTKAHGYVHDDVSRPVYVKMGGAKGALRPVTESPLVIHPLDARRLRDGGTLPSGIGLSDTPHWSQGLLKFPKRERDGRPYGYDLSVRDGAALDALLIRLMSSSASPQSAVSARPAVGQLAATSQASTPARPAPSAPEWTEPDPPATIEAMAAASAVDLDPLCSQEPPAVRRALVNARLGQGGYRQQLMELWDGRCALTGCAVPSVLIASHAVAWAECRTNAERLDKHNGLLLAASVDRLFDNGLIGFDEDGRLLRKPEVSDGDLRSIGVVPDARLCKVPGGVRAYLARHRARHGL